jgi:hypothetical protein
VPLPTVDGLAAIASSPLGSSALPASRKQKRWREPLQSTRIRRSQWEDLISRAEGGVLRGLMFLHLRADLGGGAQDWIGCNDPQENEAPEPAGDSLTSYGIRRDVQRPSPAFAPTWTHSVQPNLLRS